MTIPPHPTPPTSLSPSYPIHSTSLFSTHQLTFSLPPPTALSPKDVSDALELDRVAKNHVWKVEPSCATTGEGIFEGLAWLSNNVKLPAK